MGNAGRKRLLTREQPEITVVTGEFRHRLAQRYQDSARAYEEMVQYLINYQQTMPQLFENVTEPGRVEWLETVVRNLGRVCQQIVDGPGARR